MWNTGWMISREACSACCACYVLLVFVECNLVGNVCKHVYWQDGLRVKPKPKRQPVPVPNCLAMLLVSINHHLLQRLSMKYLASVHQCKYLIPTLCLLYHIHVCLQGTRTQKGLYFDCSLFLASRLRQSFDLTWKRGSVGQSEGLLIPRSSVRFRLNPRELKFQWIWTS